MNIQKLNPIGYEAKTEKGNTYKKSNAGKAGMLTAAAAINILPYAFPKNKVASMFSCKALIYEMAEMFHKTIPAKWQTPAAVIGVLLDFVFLYGFGASIDNSINRKRSIEADKAADNAQKDTNTVDKK